MSRPVKFVNVIIYIFILFISMITILFFIFDIGIVQLQNTSTGDYVSPILWTGLVQSRFMLIVAVPILIAFCLQIVLLISVPSAWTNRYKRRRSKASKMVFWISLITSICIVYSYDYMFNEFSYVITDPDFVPAALQSDYVLYFSNFNTDLQAFGITTDSISSIFAILVFFIFIGMIFDIVTNNKIAAIKEEQMLYGPEGMPIPPRIRQPRRVRKAARSGYSMGGGYGFGGAGGSRSSHHSSTIVNTPPSSPTSIVNNIPQQRQSPIVQNPNPSSQQVIIPSQPPITINQAPPVIQSGFGGERQTPIMINQAPPVIQGGIGNDRQLPININQSTSTPAQQPPPSSPPSPQNITTTPININQSAKPENPTSISMSPQATSAAKNDQVSDLRTSSHPTMFNDQKSINENLFDQNNYVSRTNVGINPILGVEYLASSLYNSSKNKDFHFDSTIKNNIFLNRILSENSQYELREAKLLINQLKKTRNKNEKEKILLLIYRICLNNNYLIMELKDAVLERISGKLSSQKEKKEFKENVVQSVETLWTYDKNSLINLLDSWITLMESKINS